MFTITSTMNCIQDHTTIVIARKCWVALIVDWMIQKIDCCRWQTWNQVALPWKINPSWRRFYLP
jgi:hypothetical protein